MSNQKEKLEAPPFDTYFSIHRPPLLGKPQLLKCRVVSKIEYLEPLRGPWEELRVKCGGSVFSSFDWTMLWLRHFGHVAAPKIVVAEENGNLRGVAPFVVSERAIMGVRIRRLSFVGKEVGTAEYYDLGILWDDSNEVTEAIIAAMKGMNWNVLTLADLKESRESLAFFRRIADEWHTEEIPRTPCPFVELPETGDVMMCIGAGTRRTIRRNMSKLKDEGRVSFRTSVSGEEAKDAMRTYVRQHKARWKIKGGSIFEDQHMVDFIYEAAGSSAERDYASIYEVLIDGIVASQLFCLYEEDCIRAYRIGINDKYVDYAPGSLVAYYAMQEAQRSGFCVFDFGKGAEEFKYRMGAKDRFLIGIHARRGSVRMMSKLASVPGVRGIVEKTGAKESALRKVYQ
jgi:CelD/BcsL family acetyltransferase involved in cellulose biosynthesis